MSIMVLWILSGLGSYVGEGGVTSFRVGVNQLTKPVKIRESEGNLQITHLSIFKI